MIHSPRHEGFTLVEVMISVVVIGILSALSIPAFKKVRNNAIEKSLISDGRQIALAAGQCMAERGEAGIQVIQLSKFLMGAKLSAGVSMVSSTTSYIPGATPLIRDTSGNEVAPASATLVADKVIATADAFGGLTPTAGNGGTLLQGGGFVLRHPSFDKTLSSVRKVTLSGTTATWTDTRPAGPGGTALGAAVISDLAFSVDTGEVL